MPSGNFEIIVIMYHILAWGFCQIKKNPKIREKLGSGWVGQAPTRIFFFGEKFCVSCVFFCCCTCFQKIKTWIGGVGDWGLANPSFSRIFGFF